MITVRFSRIYEIPEEETTDKDEAIKIAKNLFDEEMDYINISDGFSETIVEDDNKELIEKLENNIEELKEFIHTRALQYDDSIDIDNADLYDINMDKEPISNFDNEDLSNHNFDLGAYYAYMDIKNKLQK